MACHRLKNHPWLGFSTVASLVRGMRTKEYILDPATGLFHPVGHFFKNGIKGPVGYHAPSHSRLVGDQNHLEIAGVQKGNGVRAFGVQQRLYRLQVVKP